MLFTINFRCRQLCPQGLSTVLPGSGACPLLFYVNIFLPSVNCIKNKMHFKAGVMNIGTLMLFIAHGLERSLEFKQRYVLILNMFSWNLTKG